MRKKLIISYDGTNYGGWQIQPNRITIQQVLEEKLSSIYALQKIRVEGSGRTDAGVHALRQTAHFDEPLRPNLENDKIFRAINRMLPPDIRLVSIEDVPDTFHARFSAKGKSYVYVINSGEENAFTSRYSWHYTRFSQLCEIRKCLKILQGRQDFSSFTVERSQIESAERLITEARLISKGKYIFLCFTGEGFLYKMIRSIVGTLVFVGDGRLKAEEFKEILSMKNRSMAYDTAPPHGLFLANVYYEGDEFGKFDIKKLPIPNK